MQTETLVVQVQHTTHISAVYRPTVQVLYAVNFAAASSDCT